MREIKFRGKVENTGDWIYGFPVNRMGGDKVVQILEIGGYYENDFGTYGHVEDIDTNTLGQYTGLKDKNGKEIYEGDIVEYKDFSGGLLIFKEQPKSRGAIEIKDILSGIYLKGMGSIKGHKIEVIGNIYENPELLEV